MSRLRAALLRSASEDGGRRFDDARSLVLAQATPNPIHTRIVSGTAHRIIDSIAYALTLLEDGDAAVGERVLRTVLELQDTDRASTTYGLWSYWYEEPLDRMSPPDWNFADFIGEYLALILLRHAPRLDPELRTATEAALGHAARSVMRRDVDLDYTNIAAKGSFVLLAAARLLGDAELATYARDRVTRLHAKVSRSGTFAEFNSPPYWHVTMQALTGIANYVADAAPPGLVDDLLRLSWRHFLARWHPAIGRLGGPMARCYETDLRRSPGALVIVQSVDPEHWSFFDDASLPPSFEHIHDAVLDYAIDPALRPLLHDPGRRAPAVSELFAWNGYRPESLTATARTGRAPSDPLAVPSIGTTWFDERAALGSIDHADTWLQHRVLLGLWAERDDRPGTPSPADAPLRAVTAEVVKDGRGFASGTFSSVQHEGDVLWAFGLCSPGGDGHPVLGALAEDEQIATSDVSVRFTIRGLAPGDGDADAEPRVLVDDGPLAVGASAAVSRLSVRTASAALDWGLGAALSRGVPVTATVSRPDAEHVIVEIPWFRAAEPTPLAVNDLGRVAAVGTLRLRTLSADQPAHPPADAVSVTVGDDGLDASWTIHPAVGQTVALGLTAGARVLTRFEHARRFTSSRAFGIRSSNTR